MTLIEMEGFLRGKCLPGDILVSETTAQYLLRKLNAATELQRQLTACEATVTNLTAQVQGLAAENAVQDFIISAVKDLVRDSAGVSGWHLNGDIASWDEALPELNHSEPPATDAALAEIRAQGVDGFIAFLKQRAREFPQSIVADSLDVITNNAEQYAYSQQLRKEQGK